MTDKKLAQWKKDGYSDAAIAWLLKAGPGVKAACDHYRAVSQARLSNAIRKIGK